jgi:RNA polymerase sigma factor (sigma-70 family)
VERNGVMDAVVRDLQTLFGLGVMGTRSDGQLLDRFLERREAAVFEAIVRRHGPMVWGVCHRVLRDHHDAEDAFQATFLVLARKAAAVIPREKLGNWLYGVAYQTAMKARAQRTKRRVREVHVLEMPEPIATHDQPRDELAEALDRELSRLPEQYRTPIVMCDLEGRTQKEAASQLGWPIGTVSSRVSRARSMLARRLSRQGVALSVSSLAVQLAQDSASAGMPPWLVDSTARAAILVAAGGVVSVGVVPAQVAALTGEVMKMMLFSKIKVIAAMVLATSALVAGGTGLAYRARGSDPASQDKAPATNRQDQPADDAIVPTRDQNQRRNTGARRAPDDASREPSASARRRPDDAEPQTSDKSADNDKAPSMPAMVQSTDDPLADLIVGGDHTPEQLARAKAIIESMMTFEKEARGKSSQELEKMIEDKAKDLEEARWQVRVIEAQLRRLKAIKQSAHPSSVPPPEPQRPSDRSN